MMRAAPVFASPRSLERKVAGADRRISDDGVETPDAPTDVHRALVASIAGRGVETVDDRGAAGAPLPSSP
jgi:hypothetical protein